MEEEEQTSGEMPPTRNRWVGWLLYVAAPITVTLLLSIGRQLLNDFNLLSDEGFQPRRIGFGGKDALLWCNVLSALATTFALLVMATQLTSLYVRRNLLKANNVRQRVPRLLLWFAVFLFGSAVTHAFDILTLWVPYYYADTLVRGIAAVCGIWALVALGREIPQLMGSLTNRDLVKQLDDMRKQIAAMDTDRAKE